MRKFGFTLAEILVTLGIIGVVSALILPTFTQNMSRSQIGPRLSKAVSVFEQGVQAVLDDAQADSIMGAQVVCPGDTSLSALRTCFYSQLGTHIKGVPDNTNNRFTSSDGIIYSGAIQNVTEGQFPQDTQVQEDFIITLPVQGGEGFSTFHFHLMDDGSLRPWGGRQDAASNRWSLETNCPANNLTPHRPQYCAGHVLENNLKVQYR